MLVCGDWNNRLKMLHYVSRAPQLRLHFVSDHSNSYSGFSLTYTMRPGENYVVSKKCIVILFMEGWKKFSFYPICKDGMVHSYDLLNMQCAHTLCCLLITSYFMAMLDIVISLMVNTMCAVPERTFSKNYNIWHDITNWTCFSASSFCGEGAWTTFDGNCYQVAASVHQLTQSAAEIICKASGGHLTSLLTKQETIYLADLLSSYPGTNECLH